MNRFFLSFAVSFFVAGFCYRSHAQSFDQNIRQIIEKHKAVGLALVAVKDNKIVYDRSFGFKKMESGELLGKTDIFRIASISKSFSATAIMQLVHQKKLSLNNDVSDLIGFEVRNPAYPQIPITLKMLLSHRSSINDSRGYFALDSVNPSKTLNAAQCYNKYQPGSRYQYCNLNFNMVGTIIERVSGERFDQYIKRHILDPLELYGGYCVDSLDEKLFATLYEYDMSKDSFVSAKDAYHPRREQISDYIMGYSTPVFSPTGGMKIAAGDLAKYMMMHMNGGKGNGKRIIPGKYAKLMRQPLSEEEGYGLALTNVSNLIKGVHLTGHTGSAYGLYSAMFFNPKEKFGFIVITNGCKPGQTNGITNLLADCVNLLYQEFVTR